MALFMIAKKYKQQTTEKLLAIYPLSLTVRVPDIDTTTTFTANIHGLICVECAFSA